MAGPDTKFQIREKATENPFPGLRPFSIDESHLFFGRRGQVNEITHNLKTNKFVAVIGASGSGKSSLIYCGVIPSLMKSEGENSKSDWILITTRPGNMPLTNLLHDVQVSMDIQDEINPLQIFNEPKGIINLIKRSSKKGNVLIMIDQFEEIFRYGRVLGKSGVKEDPNLYINFLVDVVKQTEHPIFLVITMRSDFIGECSQYQDFTKLINQSNYLIPQMTALDFKEVIEGPIKVKGAVIDEKLVSKLLEDIGNNPDQLPVLQHVLMRTWNYWSSHNDQTKPISISDYEAVGMIEKALSEHANEAFDELDENEKHICESIFRTLTEKGGDNRGVRRPTKVKQLAEIAQAKVEEVIKILNVFRAPGRSFIVPAYTIEIDEDSVIDVSHESLMRIWERLRVWVDEEASAVLMYKRLAQSAAQYQEGRTRLWRPPDLQLATNWKIKTQPTLTWAERHDPAFERTMVFLETSEAEYCKEELNKIKIQKRTLRRTRIFAIVLGTAALFSLGLFLYARQQSIIAKERQIEAIAQSKLAKENAEKAQEQTRYAVMQTALADSARNEALIQQKIAEEEREKAEASADEAKRQEKRAIDNLKLARENERRANLSKAEADVQKQNALRNAEEAKQRRMRSTAKAMAVKSLQVSPDSFNLKALLAYQAFIFNESYNGSKHDADIYSGLYRALKSDFILGQSYNVYNGHNSAVNSVFFLPGSYVFYSAGSDGKILKWDLDDPEKRYQILTQGRGIIKKISISNDGKYLAAFDNRGGTMLFDLKKDSIIPKILSGDEITINSIAFGPDNKSIYITGSKNTIEYWNLETFGFMVMATNNSKINSLAISPDGVNLAGGTDDGQLIVWKTKGEVISKTIHSDSKRQIYSVAFSPDGKYLASGDIKGDITLFSTDTFGIVSIIPGSSARITDIQFSPDSKTLAASSFSGMVFNWELEDLTNPPIVMDDNNGWVYSVAFSHDGKYLVSASKEGDRLVKRPASSYLLADRFCPILKRNFTSEEWKRYIGSDIPYEKTCIIVKKSEIVAK